MKHLTMREQVRFYLQWCKDQNKKPQEFVSLEDYFKELKELEGGAF